MSIHKAYNFSFMANQDYFRGKTLLTLLILFLFAAQSCSDKDESEDVQRDDTNALAALNLPEDPFNYSNPDYPTHFTVNQFPGGGGGQTAVIQNDNTPEDNPVTDDGATLGRVLFYDVKLSANSTIACASCHKQDLGFGDSEILSTGFEGGKTGRHSMGLSNARFYASGKFFWDERAATLEDQVLMPFQDEVEMGLTLEDLVNIVSEQEYYPVLFERAFGDRSINSDRISKALAQFVRSMVSYQAKYDDARSTENDPIRPFAGFSPAENRGKTLFMTNAKGVVPCAACHQSEAFVGMAAPPPGMGNTTTATNNGLDAETSADEGVFLTTANGRDRGKFKTPSLRNIAVRAPFMHDGRFSNLEEVIDHYSTGIQDHAQLDPRLRTPGGQPARYDFTEQEKADLIAFLGTLTDQSFLTDEKFSNPFK